MAMLHHPPPEADLGDRNGWEPYSGASLATECFIPCTKDHSKAVEGANRLFKGRDDMLVLELDVDRLVSPIKHEAARSGTVYPHIYGPINTDAVVGVLALITDEDGQFTGLTSG